MSHIFNNAGVAHLVSGYPDMAIDYFEKGLDYAYRPERCIQNVALNTNKLIANFCLLVLLTRIPLFYKYIILKK